MSEKNRALSIIGIMIALDAAFWDEITNNWLIFFMINIIWIIICILISYIEEKLEKQNKRWIDFFYYIFSKGEKKYKIENKIVEFEILNNTEACYKQIVVTKIKEKGFPTYSGRYAWDQENGIKVEPLDENQSYEEMDEMKWTKITTTEQRFLKRGQLWTTGFKLKKMTLTNLKKGSYLSCKVVEKIETLDMILKIHENIEFEKKAFLYVEDYLGRYVTDEEEVLYDESIKGFKKTLKYPRKGRKYIIKVILKK